MDEQNTAIETPVEVTAPVEQQPTKAELNIREMRKKLEAEEKARKEAENRAAQLEREREQYKASSTIDDDFVDEDKRKIQMLEARLNMIEVESVTAKMADFNELVTDDNLKTLERLYPDEHASLMYNPNIKSRAKAAYNMLKNYGIVEDKTKKVHDRIDANKSRPASASVAAPQTSTSPLARLDEYGRRVLSDEDRDQVMKEVARKKRFS